MSANLQSISQTIQQLKSQPIEQQLRTISQLKVDFVSFPSFLLDERFLKSVQNHTLSDESKQEILLVREALETIVTSIALNFNTMDSEQAFKLFEQNYNLLSAYYGKHFHNLPKSQRENLIVGLRLLALLAQNRMAKFHAELELLPYETRQDMYIRHPIELEMYLMEGSYNKLRTVIEKVPAKEYTPFMEYLVRNSVRNEIASCIEKAYEHLKLSSAQQLLIFKSVQETEKWVRDNTNWRVDGGVIYFENDRQETPFRQQAKTFIERTLEYAEETNRIV